MINNINLMSDPENDYTLLKQNKFTIYSFNNGFFLIKI